MLKHLNPLWLIENFLICHWVGAAISIGGSLIGGMMGDDASSGAAGDANAGIQAGIDEINRIGDRTRSDTQPYRDLGTGAVNKLSYLLGTADTTSQGQYNSKYGTLLDMSGGVPKAVQSLYNSDPAYRDAYDQILAAHKAKYTNSNNPSGGYTRDSDSAGLEAELRRRLPGVDSFSALDTSDGKYGSLLNKFGQNDLNNDVVYNNGLQFGLDEGTKAIDNRARAMGGYDSGSVLKALTRYGNDYGTTKTEGAYNRYVADNNNIYTKLMGGTTVGQNAVNTDASTGANMATALSGANTSMGANNAAGRVGSANAWSNAVGGISNTLGGMDWSKILNGSSSGGTSIPIKF